MNQSDLDDFAWITLPGTTDNLSQFQQFILDQADRLKVPAGIVQKIELILEEVLLNIINYAFHGSQTKDIRTGCALSGDGWFRIRIIDQGAPFDPSSRKDPDTSLGIEDRSIGGLGIFLVRQMSDNVSYQRVDGQNILDIGFKL